MTTFCLRGIRLAVGMVFASAIGIVPQTVVAQPPAKGEDPGTMVRTAVAQVREVNRTQTFIGSLQPVRRAVIGSAVADRVAEVLVDEGHFVTGPVKGEDGQVQPGQTLVQISRATIDMECAAAEVELELRRQALEELGLTIPLEIELARANVNQIKAQREFAEQVYRRHESLGSAASQRELEESRSQFQTQSQALAAAEAELAKLESTREVRLKIAQQNIAVQEAEVARLEELRSKYTITAPFSGHVVSVPVERGNWVTPGTVVVDLVQLDPIEMKVSVPQEYLGNLQKTFASAAEPPEVEVRVGSLEQPVKGTLAGIIPQADERTRAVPVIIRIPNPVMNNSHPLYPGLLAEVSLSIGEEESAIMVPKDALVLGQGTTTVFVVEKAGAQMIARQVSVRTGAATDQWMAVYGDIKEGDTVVTHGNERLRDGQPVRISKDDSSTP